jgi:hypothetical protein
MNETQPRVAVTSNTRYELPPSGITLLGYVVRRMHKTALLLPVTEIIQSGETAQALAQVAWYAAGASASFGPAYYQPMFNQVGDVVSEADPATGVLITAKLESRSPHFRISYSFEMPDSGRFEGTEEVTGTTVSLSGLGMPAPSHFRYVSGDGKYTAQMTGVITSELVPGFLVNSRIRAYGKLDLRDGDGHTGALKLARNGEVELVVEDSTGARFARRVRLAP